MPEQWAAWPMYVLVASRKMKFDVHCAPPVNVCTPGWIGAGRGGRGRREDAGRRREVRNERCGASWCLPPCVGWVRRGVLPRAAAACSGGASCWTNIVRRGSAGMRQMSVRYNRRMLTAIGLGGLAAGSLVIGALLAFARTWSKAQIGLVLAFGAGALISAVSVELVEEGVAARRPGLDGGRARRGRADVLPARRGDRARASPGRARRSRSARFSTASRSSSCSASRSAAASRSAWA